MSTDTRRRPKPYLGDDEPTGSCDDCDTNLYGDEMYEGLCDHCSWARYGDH